MPTEMITHEANAGSQSAKSGSPSDAEQEHLVGLSLKAVGDLKDFHFFIPSYQRGYRWEPEQVEALLNDLHEFEKCHGDNNKFYCLQPLVVVKRPRLKEKEWEVVDGQQRLTTIFLILKHLDKPRFTIHYERHLNPDQDLPGLFRPDSPDSFFGQKADEAIQTWLHKHPENKLLATLTNCNGNGPCAKFIWDEIGSGPGEAIHAFTRLNSGKIRLKDSELIRAAMLQSGILPESDRQRIAIEWDRVEWRLQNPEFWSFLNGKGQAPDSRIERLFNLLAENEGQGQKNNGDRKIFDKYFERLKKAEKPAKERQELWAEVDALFGTLDEWFEDHCLFHLIGFLTALRGSSILHPQDAKPDQLLSQKTKTKTEFIINLKREIRNDVLPSLKSAEGIKSYFDKLNYGESNDQIRSVLLCLNIATLLVDETKTARFSFAAYQGDEWDIEHIRATASREPETAEELRNVIKMMVAYNNTTNPNSDSRENDDDLKALDNEALDRERLVKLYQSLRDKIEGEDEFEASNNIKNLTLLDSETNRSYGNNPFAMKRQRILGVDQTKYLLPSTRSVFTKSYSKAPGSLLHWTQKDADEYMAAMVQVLTEFFKDTWETKS